jgi:Family of unknown function (DUF6311)
LQSARRCGKGRESHENSRKMNENLSPKIQAQNEGPSGKHPEGLGCQVRKFKVSSWPAFLIGGLAFVLLTGGHIARPGNVGWVMQGDPGMNYLGWTFFRNAPLLQQPFGANWQYGMEMSSSIVYSDSLPLLAFLLKPISAGLPENFQYFGIWTLLCFLLQAFFAWKLLERIQKGVCARVLGTLFFVLAPAFLFRIHGHLSLGAHWLILASLYLYLSPRFPEAAWILLLVVASLITPILLAMALLIFIAALAKHFFCHDLTLVKVAGVGGLTFIILLFAMWEAGYFMVSTPGGGGFGFYRASLLGFVDPTVNGLSWSRLLRDQPQSPGNYEGFCFLGTGMIVLAIVACVEIIRSGARWIPCERLWPLLLIFGFCTVFALSNNIGIGPYIIFHYNLPLVVERLVSPFRGSGRFIWIPYYLLMAGILTILFKSFQGKIALVVLALCLFLQVVDCWPALQINRNAYTAKIRPATLDSPFWAAASERYDKIVYVLPRDGIEAYIPLCIFAARHRMPVNFGHCARIDDNKLAAARKAALHTIEAGPLDSKALYVFDTGALWDLGLHQMRAEDWAGIIDGYKVIAPGWTQNSDRPVISTLRPVMGEYSVGSQLLFTGGAKEREFLGYGWSHPEAEGVWSDGDRASVVLLLKQLPDSDVDLLIDGAGFASPKCSRQEINIRVNSVSLGEISYSVKDPAGPRSIRIPRQVLVSDDGLVEIEFRFHNNTSPERLGLSLDTRDIALMLKGLRLMPVDNGSTN